MPNQPIPVSTADKMMQAYVAYMQKLGVDMNKQTQTVSFSKKEVMEWLNEVMQYADELRICFGNYLPDQDNPGRDTVILWPYLNGRPAVWPTEGKDGGGDPNTPIPPFNEGQGKP